MLPLNKCTLENMATAQQKKIDCKLKFIPDLCDYRERVCVRWLALTLIWQLSAKTKSIPMPHKFHILITDLIWEERETWEGN